MRRTRAFWAVLIVCLWAPTAFLMGELVVRVFFSQRAVLYRDARNLLYRYDAELGWFPIANSDRRFEVERAIHTHHNSAGFRDVEHVFTPGRRRMLVLGDSFVWGSDVEESERFTEQLRPAMPAWSIYNLGVSGYGTDQEYLLLQKYFDRYAPEVVLLVFFGGNDELDNSSNSRYDGYYKPYFVKEGDTLRLQGVPVPQSRNYFFAGHRWLQRSFLLRALVSVYYDRTAPATKTVTNPTTEILLEMRRFVERKGARLIVGTEDARPAITGFLEREHFEHLDLSNPYRYRGVGHWTPQGHQFVARTILDFLARHDFPDVRRDVAGR